MVVPLWYVKYYVSCFLPFPTHLKYTKTKLSGVYLDPKETPNKSMNKLHSGICIVFVYRLQPTTGIYASKQNIPSVLAIQ
jgi:hypothetical protein